MKKVKRKATPKPGSSGKPSSIWPNGESGEGEACKSILIFIKNSVN
jgi:hypothetical protein